MPPSELERLEFYRVENILREYEEHVDKENKEYEKQQKQAELDNRAARSSTPTQPKFEMPKISMPKFEMPKFQMPK